MAFSSSMCRTCLQEINNNPQASLDIENSTGLTLITNLLNLCSELDVRSVPRIVLCESCLKTINIFHRFKNQCYETEDRIYKYLESNNFVTNAFHSPIIYSIENYSTSIKQEIKIENTSINDYPLNNYINNSDYSSICRTCLQTTNNKSQIFPLERNKNTFIFNKLYLCCPEVDLYIIPKAVLCRNCFDAINTIYQFRIQCFESETQINREINNIQSVSLIDVFRDINSLNYIKHEIKVEEINIDDVDMTNANDDIQTEDHYFVCYICGYRTKIDLFSYLTQLNIKPNVAYMEINRFKCIQCQCTDVEDVNINEDIFYDTNIKLFICGKCQYNTSQESNIKQHLVTHSNPFEYSFYGKKAKLDRYRLIHPNDELIKLNGCGTTKRFKIQKHIIKKQLK